jgi:hypothetical protein
MGFAGIEHHKHPVNSEFPALCTSLPNDLVRPREATGRVRCRSVAAGNLAGLVGGLAGRTRRLRLVGLGFKIGRSLVTGLAIDHLNSSMMGNLEF